MDAQTARTIQRHGLGAWNGEDFARERRGWVEQLPSVRREEVKIHPLLVMQLTNFSQCSRVGTNWDDAATLRHVPIPTLFIPIP
jgi:hypothetical protein